MQKGREDNEERNLILNQLTKLKNEEDNLKKQIQKYKDSDPEVIEKLKSDIKVKIINLLLYKYILCLFKLN